MATRSSTKATLPGIYAGLPRGGSQGKLDPFPQIDGGGPGHRTAAPEFAEFPTVSMAGPLNAVAQARFNRYLPPRDGRYEGGQVWAFVGDGEMDEPKRWPAASEQLDNLILSSTNLQRLDRPVRGNGVIQELERFRGAG